MSFSYWTEISYLFNDTFPCILEPTFELCILLPWSSGFFLCHYLNVLIITSLHYCSTSIKVFWTMFIFFSGRMRSYFFHMNFNPKNCKLPMLDGKGFAWNLLVNLGEYNFKTFYHRWFWIFIKADKWRYKLRTTN